MNSDEATRGVIDVLEDIGIPYMLVGSNASNFHGIPRSTKDADFVIELGSFQMDDIVRRLGTAFHLDPQMSFETATFTFRHIISIVDSPFTIELFHLGDDEYDRERFERRVRAAYLSGNVWVASKEDVIVTKLLWLLRLDRSKDKDDVTDVILVQQDKIDWTYVEKWCYHHGTRALLDGIRQSLAGLI